jgi:hypothetical protein
LEVTLDIAAVLSALIWPLVVLIVLLAYRHQLPGLFNALSNRLTGVGVAGFSIELAVAKPFTPEWASLTDLRNSATPVQITDSVAATFLSQLRAGGKADYAEANLGCGEEWLTSRLFIMAIVFARTKGIHAFVFVETTGGFRRRYIGWAAPEQVRWALASRYRWLEHAYADAYAAVLTQQPNTVVASNQGRLGYDFDQANPDPSVQLVREFLQRVQAAAPMLPTDRNGWVLIDAPTDTWEHASRLDGALLEDLLGTECKRAALSVAELRTLKPADSLHLILSEAARFTAITGPDQRFEYLIDRDALLPQAARQLARLSE